MILLKESDEAIITNITIPDNMSDVRLDVAISSLEEDISRNRAQSLIAAGNIEVNGNIEKSKKSKISSGDKITITMQKEVPLDVEPEDIPLDIMYEDSYLIVINKPKGMVVHPAPGNLSGTLVNALLFHSGDSLSGVNGVIRPGIVHRIDKDTSGLLVVAKNDSAHKLLSEQLASHSMEREYEAIVLNNIKEDEGTIDAPIGRDPKNRLKNNVIDNGRRAVTHFKVLKRYGKYTYVKLNLETGRTHQIRVHMSHMGHPLLGDSLYSNAKNSFGVKTQMLHAKTLGFVHPESKQPVKFESQLPLEFQEVLSKLDQQK